MSNHSSAPQGTYAYTDTLKGVYYGPGCLPTALPQLLETLNVKKAFIVTGHSLQTKTDVVRKVEDVLKQHDAYADTFWEIGEHAPIKGINNGIQALKKSGADVIVSVGGGSPIDAAKAIIYYLQKDTGGEFLRQIAIPTTLSAAEFTIGAGFTNQEGHKEAVSSHQLPPAGIILDAELTLATPERLWLSTGIRALDHAVENLYRPLVPEPIKVLCYAALAELFKYLPLSKAEPQNIEFRQKLQVAAWMSLWPLKLTVYSALGLSHALGHKLGATYNIAHGITSCLTLAPTVALKADTASPEDKQNLADALFYLRLPSTGSIEGDVLKLSAEIDGLVAKLGLKTDLAACKVPLADVPKIAEQALGGKQDALYPKVVTMLERLHSAPALAPTL